jgi:hypothetical protein
MRKPPGAGIQIKKQSAVALSYGGRECKWQKFRSEKLEVRGKKLEKKNWAGKND